MHRHPKLLTVLADAMPESTANIDTIFKQTASIYS
jgi:hypothetical protein